MIKRKELASSIVNGYHQH